MKYHIMRVSFDYDDWRRILIGQDDEYLRCIMIGILHPHQYYTQLPIWLEWFF